MHGVEELLGGLAREQLDVASGKSRRHVEILQQGRPHGDRLREALGDGTRLWPKRDVVAGQDSQHVGVLVEEQTTPAQWGEQPAKK